MKRLRILMLACAITVAGQAAFSQAAPDKKAPQAPPTAGIPGPSVITALRYVSLASYQILEIQLNLTDAQKPKVRALLTKAEEAARTSVEAQRKAGKAFADALVAGADDSTLASLGQAAIKADSQILAEKLKTLTALRALLDDQQKKGLSKMLDYASSPWRVQMPPPPSADAPASTPGDAAGEKK